MITGPIDVGFKRDITEAQPRASIRKNDLAIGSGASGTLPDTITTPGAFGTGAGRDDVVARRESSPNPRLPSNRVLHGTYAYFTDCLECLARATGEEDIVAKENALNQFNGLLKELWDYQANRDETFAEAINMFQNIFVGRSLDDFVDAQLVAVSDCIEQLRDEQVWDDAVLNDVTGKLLEAGIDVFRELA